MYTLLVPLDGSALRSRCCHMCACWHRCCTPMCACSALCRMPEIERLLAYGLCGARKEQARFSRLRCGSSVLGIQLCARARHYLDLQTEQLRAAGLRPNSPYVRVCLTTRSPIWPNVPPPP